MFFQFDSYIFNYFYIFHKNIYALGHSLVLTNDTLSIINDNLSLRIYVTFAKFSRKRMMMLLLKKKENDRLNTIIYGGRYRLINLYNLK